MYKSTKFGKVMKEYKRGQLRSGAKRGPKVKNRKQAIAIAHSESDKYKAKGKSGNPHKDLPLCRHWSK